MTLALKKTDLLALAIAVILLAGGKFDWAKLTGNTKPSDSAFVPAAELQAVVTPIAALVVGDKAAVDRVELAGLFSALAEFHARDKATIVSTVQLLQRHNDLSLEAFYQGADMKGRYASLGSAIDAALGKYLGILSADGKYKAGPIDASGSVKVAAFDHALAWAFSQPITAKG